MVAGPATGTSNNTSPIELDYLAQEWVRSYEEEPTASRIQIYRPERFKEYPSSRFRKRYIFERDGSCRWFYLAPNDAHHFRDGTWRVDPADKDIIQIDEGEEKKMFRILELTQDLLRMEPIVE